MACPTSQAALPVTPSSAGTASTLCARSRGQLLLPPRPQFGEVIVGKIGVDLGMDDTAQRHTVGLAQRMEQAEAEMKGLG